MKNITILFVLFIVKTGISFSQTVLNDSIKIEYDKIYSFCLDGDVKTALTFLNIDPSKKISAKDLKFKVQFENRFKTSTDQNDSTSNIKTPIDGLLKIYHNYWRQSLLNNAANYDTVLFQDVYHFLVQNYPPAATLVANEDSVAACFKKYIESYGLHTTGAGKTGKLFDLLVWKTETDTTYSFTSQNEKTSSRVILMDNFITLGWEEYATLNRYYPGGWATSEALYCVKKAYDMHSEDFLISYLAHESRHFADYKLFPKLSSADLEYRAKLTELSMAQKTLYETIAFFINNANYDSDNGHSIANYSVIRDLSKKIFKNDFEKDRSKWKSIDIKIINNAALEILLDNTKSLEKLGKDVEKYIKK